MDEQYPDFVITCDHGIADGEPEPLARYEWVDARGVWEPRPDCKVPRDSDPKRRRPGVTVTYLEGEREGWFHANKADDELSRVHHDIRCLPQCRRRDLRVPDDHLQALFALIAASPARSFKEFREQVASVGDGQITVTLFALHAALAEVDRYGLLRQQS